MILRRKRRPLPWAEGKRVSLRPLVERDFAQFQEVRLANVDWLEKWEPLPPKGSPDPVRDRTAFLNRCDHRRDERQNGVAFAFGVFLGEVLIGEMNLTGISRGASHSGYVGYWIDERHAGNGYTPEALVCLMQFAFETLELHRIQVSVVPRNTASRRVVEKLELRQEGVAQRYLQINGVWEDHIRYAITEEEWVVREAELVGLWLDVGE